MRYLHEFRDPDAAHRLVEQIAAKVSQPWTLMEVCGGQTHAIVRFGIDQLLPDAITLVHGPGCPVCVTPVQVIDRALALAALPDVVFCSFGDMLRVPGSGRDLLQVRAAGGDVRVVYSPLDALSIARSEPNRQVVFFAVGFETTAPAVAMAVHQAKAHGVSNFSVLVAHVLVPPAIAAIAASPDSAIDGFLAAGHVCTVMGTEEYEPLAERYRIPIVVTGFEPVDLLRGVLEAVNQLEEGRYEVVNAYERVVRPGGNPAALSMTARVFRVVAQAWRGIGEIESSGLGLAPDYARFDAATRFDVEAISAPEDPSCVSGQVLQGILRPEQCPQFGVGCTPETPLGAPMVSSEGACAAYYKYRRRAS